MRAAAQVIVPATGRLATLRAVLLATPWGRVVGLILSGLAALAGAADVIGLFEKLFPRDEVDQLTERNAQLQAEVDDLRTGLAAVEDRARTELGMIKPGETFIRVIE